MVFMYHKDCPEGRVFESEKDAPRGWVDTPAKLGRGPGRPKKAEADGDGS